MTDRWDEALLAGLRAAGEAAYDATTDATRALRGAALGLGDETALLAGMRTVAEMVLAMEALEDAASAHATRLREALLHALDESNGVGVETAHHRVVKADGPAGVHITDPALIPADLMRRPEPVPDKKAIERRLRAGEAVPGAALRNGRPYLRYHPIQR
ncbi:siphovirus Gp157 family protein [Roseomonas sp. NAR14]|uniref:Siphovirus Gp157 family protein n=1 Tax=Roseomonas acroporae TaxID=2937791 RepID=A0A9X1YFV8_9PROT|nr:siphovirus Gp157 family protein [Roseomonas acroporae]MCK8788123.1 siphovirus Gp157 family protein [Roseomonas acroporae]